MISCVVKSLQDGHTTKQAESLPHCHVVVYKVLLRSYSANCVCFREISLWYYFDFLVCTCSLNFIITLISQQALAVTCQSRDLGTVWQPYNMRSWGYCFNCEGNDFLQVKIVLLSITCIHLLLPLTFKRFRKLILITNAL